jgi:photosystem II stability/assembly factor-like uncharacterized protein
MKKAISLAFSFVFISFATFAQDWVNMMNDPSVNVHDVQNAFGQWYAQHKNDNKDIVTNGNKEAEEEGTQLYRRWEYLMVPRTYPTGNRPDQIAITNAYCEYLKNANKASQENRTMNTANWTYIGNTSVPQGGFGSNGTGDGRINRIEIYPGNSNTLYACSPGGGLWKSTNGGTSWGTNTDQQLLALGTADLAINPLNPSMMFLATGDNDGFGSGYTPATLGIMRSTDGGITWDTTGLAYTIQSSGAGRISSNQVVFSPIDTGRIFAATTSGLYYSKNDGFTWHRVISANIKQVAFEPLHGNTVYASSYAGGFYRSTDSGNTFTQIVSGLPSGTQRTAIGVTPADSNTVYVITVDNNGAFFGIYRSTDRGQTFSAVSTAAGGAPNILGWSPNGSDATGQGWYDLAFAVSPTYADSLFVGGPNLWESSSGGVSWHFNNSFSNNVHVDIHDIKFLPGSSKSFLLTCDGGVYKTTDAGVSWTDISNNLEIAEQYSIGLSASTANLLISGWQDNNVNISGTPSWKSTYGGDGMTCFIDHSNDQNMFAESEYAAFGSSTDGGVSWSNATNGITENGTWNTPWLQAPRDPNTLFAGLTNVWESNDAGNSWYKISPWTAGNINALAVAPARDSVIYVSIGYRLFATTNGGNTWSIISAGLPVSGALISNITVNQFDPSHLWVTFSGWTAADKVCESTDGGAHWTNISSGLPNLPVNCIVNQPGSHDGIYVGTDIGVYYKDSTTGGWISYNNGLPNVEVFDLKLFKDNTLVAGTFGRGTWQTNTYSNVNAGINNLPLTNSSVNIYPNPTTGNVQVAFDGPEGQYQIRVVNVLGQTVYSNNVTATGHYTSNINLSGNQQGIYIVTITGANTKVEKKVVLY